MCRVEIGVLYEAQNTSVVGRAGVLQSAVGATERVSVQGVAENSLLRRRVSRQRVEKSRGAGRPVREHG